MKPAPFKKTSHFPRQPAEKTKKKGGLWVVGVEAAGG